MSFVELEPALVVNAKQVVTIAAKTNTVEVTTTTNEIHKLQPRNLETVMELYDRIRKAISQTTSWS